MRIAIMASPRGPVPPPKYGGIEQVIYYLIKGLIEEGHEPVLFGPGDSTVQCEIVPTVSRATYFPKTTARLPAYQKRVEQINKKTGKLLRKQLSRFDIIHSHDFDLLPFKDFPNLTTLHGPVTLDNLDYFMDHKDLFYASISNNQQGTFPSLPFAGTVYNGLDPSEFPVVQKPQDYLCFLGRLDDEKNPLMAIKLAIRLGIPIKVAGKVDFLGETYFKEKIEPYFAHPLVEYLGELGFKDKVDLISNAKCNLHPTNFREPFGLTVLEAAYCGTPTLATSRGSMPELIENGRTGVLVEDFVEGYHYIEQCFEMDRLYIASRAWSLFNYRTMAKGYLKAYQQVIDTYADQAKQENNFRHSGTILRD
jgi:glycosyltransferase involved in cell wall biosynthesis